jgi:hypothetical protein
MQVVLARLRNVHDDRLRFGIHELQAPGVRHIRGRYNAIPNDGILPLGIGIEEVAIFIIIILVVVVIVVVVSWRLPSIVVADRLRQIALSYHVLHRIRGQ